MSFWSTIKRWLGFAAAHEDEAEEVITLASAVVKDVTTVVIAGPTPAGAVAAVKTVQDIATGVQRLQGAGSGPPLTAKDVASEQAQIKSASRPVPLKAPPPPSRK